MGIVLQKLDEEQLGGGELLRRRHFQSAENFPVGASDDSASSFSMVTRG
jgi:hypothetical protein